MAHLAFIRLWRKVSEDLCELASLTFEHVSIGEKFLRTHKGEIKGDGEGRVVYWCRAR